MDGLHLKLTNARASDFIKDPNLIEREADKA